MSKNNFMKHVSFLILSNLSVSISSGTLPNAHNMLILFYVMHAIKSMLFRFSAKETKKQENLLLDFFKTRKGSGNKEFPDWNPQTEFSSVEENRRFQGIRRRNLRFILLSQQVENPVFNLKSYSTFNLPSCTESAAGTAGSAVSTSPFVT